VDKKRPVNLDLGTIALPITSYVSILHRVSGVIMFFAVAVLLWLLESSLASEASFNELSDLFNNPLCQIIVWGTLAALAYHSVAGMRHMIMDFGVGEDSFYAGRLSAWAALALAALVIALITLWVFL
jgi:succinate dehydrogenase / fumarate reductase cytochrome b subunit|tara:strand:- start:194 stop:574 length:381 start_codon:yes stop_codon:yes gene_type:complete